VGVTLVIIGYSFLFSPALNNYPIHSLCDKYHVPQQRCVSKGLSRAFSYIVRFEFDKAEKMNKFAPRIFLFFFVQMLLRMFLILFNKRTSNRIIWLDIIVSALLFIWAFGSFIYQGFAG
jgi:hypothetical protein